MSTVMSRSIRYVLICAGGFALVYFMVKSPIFRGIIDTIFISFIIAYSLKPIQEKIMEKGVSRKLSALILLLGLVAGICLIFIFLIPSVLRETLNISSAFDELKIFIDNINRSIEKLSSNRYMKNIIEGGLVRLEGMIKSFSNNALDNLLKKSENIFSFAVIPILVYYLLSDGTNIGKSLYIFVPMRKRRVFRNLSSDINVVLSKYIISQFLLSVLISVMTFVILVALKVDFPLLLSLINGIFNIIPYFGPLLGGIPPVVVALLISPKLAIWTAICLNLIQQIEGDMIAPKITGDSVDMHPLYVILLLILGGKVGGFVGMVLAVPVAVMIKVIIEDLDYYMY